MAQINAGQNLGNVAIEPTRWSRIAAPNLAAVASEGWRQRAAQEADEAARVLRQQSEEVARARTVRATVEGEFAIDQARTQILEDLRAGRLRRGEVEATWQQRVGDIDAQAREAAAAQGINAEALAATLRGRSLRAQQQLAEGLRALDNDHARADVLATLDLLAATPVEDRPTAIARARAILDAAKRSGAYAADDAQRLMNDFGVRMAAADAARMVFDARDSSAALDDAQRRLNGPDFAELPQQRRLEIERQLDARRQFLTMQTEATINRAEADRQKLEAAAYGQAQLQVVTAGKVDPKLWQSLKPAHQAELIRAQRAEARARRAEAEGRSVRTDPTLYIDLREAAMRNPAKFMTTNLRQYVDRIGPRELEQLLDLQGGIAREQLKGAAKVPKDAVSLSQQLNATAAALKITRPADKGKFMSYVQGEVDAATQSKGKPLTFAERQQIIDQAVLQGDDPSALLWGKKRVFQLTPQERGRFKPDQVSDAPATEIDALNEALRARGLPQTPANRLRLYQQANSMER